MPEDLATRRMRIWTPDPSPVDPGVLAGVPSAPLTLEDILARRHVCFAPDELRNLLERARTSYIELGTPDGGTEKIEYRHHVVNARVDDATLYFLRRLYYKYRLTRSEAIRLGIFLLREVLEKQEV